jgi:hypothetical protein
MNGQEKGCRQAEQAQETCHIRFAQWAQPHHAAIGPAWRATRPSGRRGRASATGAEARWRLEVAAVKMSSHIVKYHNIALHQYFSI